MFKKGVAVKDLKGKANKISTKLLVMVIIAGIVPTLSLLLVTNYFTGKTLKENFDTRALAEIKHIDDGMTFFLDGVSSNAISLASSDEVIEGLTDNEKAWGSCK